MVRRAYSIIFLSFFSIAIFSQTNLVPNPSFEDTVNCPFAAGDINKATGWTTLCGSPDLFNICNQYSWGVPNNIFGYQMPANGNGYAGFITYSDVALNTREFPACNLTASLTIGVKYYISFKIALSLENIANPTNCASDKIGAKFTMGTSICNSLINNTPPVFTNSVITDSLNWTRISGSFVADSAYSYLVIGNFFDDANTNTTKFFNSWWSDFAYYYLDDICVSTDSAFTANYYTGVNTISSKNDFSIFPNPAHNILILENFYKNEEYKILNIMGTIVKQGFCNGNKNTIDVSDLSNGLYFVMVREKKMKLLISH